MTVPAEQPAYEPETPPEFQRLGLGYVYRPRSHAVQLRLDYVDQSHGDISGMLLVESALPGTRKHLHQARFNLTSTQTRSSLSKHLDKLTGGNGQIPWGDILEAFCAGVIQAEMAGEPIVKVGKLATRARTPDRIEGLLEEGKPNSLYGPGGGGKGFLSVLMCVCIKLGIPFLGRRVTQGNPLYCDWEDDPEVLDFRIKMVSAGLGVEPPDIDYQPMRTALRYQINQIAANTDKNGNDFIVIDSVERAIGASADARTYEALAKSLFESLGYLKGMTSLLIDHVAESSRQNFRGVNKAYGSIMKGNWCRRAWELKSVPEQGRPVNHVGLYQFKGNHVASVRPIGILMDFTQEGKLLFSRENLAEIPGLSDAMRIEDRISAILRTGALPVPDIAEAIGLDQDTVRATVNRLSRSGKTFVKLSDNRIGLLDTANRGPIPIRSDLMLPYDDENASPESEQDAPANDAEPDF